MLSKLKEIIQIEDLSVWITTDHKVGTGFEIKHCDVETEDFIGYSKKITQFIRNLDPSVLARVQLDSYICNDIDDDISRKIVFEKMGYRKNKTFLYINHIESELNLSIAGVKSLLLTNKDYSKKIESLLKTCDLIKSCGLEINPLTQPAIQKLFNSDLNLTKTTKSLESPYESIGVIRLNKQPSFEINHNSFFKVLNKIENISVSVSLRNLSESYSKLLLEKKLKQFSAGKGIDSQLQTAATTDTIKNQFIQGSKLVEFEFLLILRRGTQAALIKDLCYIESELKSFGDFKIETYGVAESFIATNPSSNQHVTLLESDELISLFLPLFLKNDHLELINKMSLSLQRSDKSICNFNLFNPKFNCYNALIIGSSGKGKSVLTGLLSQSLLNDTNNSIIKIDVGGSHSKECTYYSGIEYILRLDQPSGINPFMVIKTDASISEKISILAKFLSVLILENNELIFSKELRSQIESEIHLYIDSEPVNPSINGFFEFAKNFPRRNLLRRWTTGGVFESAFASQLGESISSDPKPRLQYYNFSQIFQASDPEFAQAGIAAVLAQFNIDCINSKNKRIILICDETPFFIKTCFDFFKFSTANVRKYGHAVILITQLSTDLIVNNDSGIIENSPQRFLFSADGDLSAYQPRFNLTDAHMHELQNLKSIPKKFSEVLLQYNGCAKKLKIELSNEERWLLTTSMEDKNKIEKVQIAFPELSLQEILKCLSLT